MIYKLLYIDDDNAGRISGAISGFSKDGSIEVVHSQPLDSLETQIESLCKQIKNEAFNGLILDLRLDDYKNANGVAVQFRGTTLAQEIRTRQKEGIMKTFPLFLFSGNDKISESLDIGGDKCFDLCIEKENIDSSKFPFYRNRFCAMIDAYNSIKENPNTLELLDLKDDSHIDEQFIYDFGLQRKTLKTPNSFLHFLVDEVLEKNGVLISENVLAARLGIDIYSSKDWTKVKESLSCSSYKGILSSSWERWWMTLVDLWWTNIIDKNSSLRSLSADQRVNKIKSALKLADLDCSTPINKASSVEYWTICLAYNRPLDPIDGLVVANQDNLYSWQDISYVSIEGALNRANIENWIEISKSEELRFEDIKELYSRKRSL